MPIGKMTELLIEHGETPGSCRYRGFYAFLGGLHKPKAGYRLIVPVQPFVDVVGNYTCQNGKK